MEHEDTTCGVDGLISLLGIRFTEATPERCEAVMPITDAVLQPFGFVHGGATLALLETVASRAAELRADLETERPFGTRVDVRHRKSGRAGSVRGVAELERVEGVKQIWRVNAYDDEGDVMSTGTFETKIVTLAYLAERGRR
ncbi:PaaI family thioesterase [Enterorhabdus sp. P55]|uniref:PaaI family thioesterase n=1 Tax=Enterorhabdus sp. P55 TaxID=2304571 RepID=UPI00136B488F|nr:PaaI family thioesterase [Enterorhabdus sp. P55]NBI33018.1 PaaI family thioesterase [Enterorhabdus sp. P55]